MKNKQIEKHENGFEFNEETTERKRERFLLDGEIVGLQCGVCKKAFALENFNNKKKGIAGKQGCCKSCDNTITNEWTRKNKARKIAGTHNYRAKIFNNRGQLTKEMVEQMFDIATRIEEGKKVVFCQISGKPVKTPELGHVIAVDQMGGHSSLKNMIVISKAVNVSQGDMNLFKWLLTEKGQGMANKKQVKWTVEYLANLNCKSPEGFLFSQLELEEAILFDKIYIRTK